MTAQHARQTRTIPTPGMPAAAAPAAPQPVLSARPAPAEYAQYAGGDAGAYGGHPANPYEDAGEAAAPPTASIEPPPPPAAPALPPNTIALRKPLKVQGETVTHLTFRKPGVRDIRICGYPMRNMVGPDGRVNGVDQVPDVVARYIALLAEGMRMPPSVVDTMDVDDFDDASAVIVRFFMG